MTAGPDTVPAGSRIRLQDSGRPVLGGVLDKCMPDGSAFWLEDGAGRRHHQENFLYTHFDKPCGKYNVAFALATDAAA